MKIVCCERCIYWSQVYDGKPGGYCKRFPPKTENNQCVWPNTKGGTWCGEFRDEEGLSYHSKGQLEEIE